MLRALDHTETGDDMNTTNPVWDTDDSGPQLFEVRGQIRRVDPDCLVIEGSWEWLGPGCDQFTPEHNVFSVVRGAIQHVWPM